MTSERDSRQGDWAGRVPPEGRPPQDPDESLDPSGAPGPFAPFGEPSAPPPAPQPLHRISPRTTPAPLVDRGRQGQAPEYVDADFKPLPAEDADQSPLRNPYVIAAIAVGAAILLAVLVVIFAGGDDGNGATTGVVINPLTPGPGRGQTFRSVAAATLREGPSLDYPALGELPRNQEVEVIGRSQDGRWFMIYYPPGSNLRGWVPATALNVPANRIDQITVVDVTPIPRPTVIVPTPTPEPASPTPEQTPTSTPTQTPGPDLAVGVLPNNCQPNAALVVTVANVGATAVQQREIRLTVATQAGVVRVLNTTVSLEPGGAVNIATDHVLTQQTRVTLDLIGAPADINPANNSAVCNVSSVAPTSTPSGGVTPPPIPTSTPGP